MCHQRIDDVLGDVHELPHVDAGLDAHAIEHRHEHLERRVARAGAHACRRAVDARGARFDRRKRVRNAHVHIVVPVKTDLYIGIELLAKEANARSDVVREHVPGRVGDVEAVRAIALHEPGLLEELLRRDHVGHHQEAHGIHLHLGAEADVLLRHVRFGAMRGHANRVHTAIMGHPQVIDRADPWKQQRRNLRILHLGHDRAEVLFVGRGGKTVVHRRPAKTVAVRDLDQRHARLVERRCNLNHLLRGELVTLRMHPVAQAHVVKRDFLPFEIHAASARWISSAMSSAVRKPAAVMMSRLPAYFGRKSPSPSTSMKNDTRLPSNTGPFLSV